MAESSIEPARQAAARALAQQAIAGLALDEFAERANALQRAATADELGAAVRGLPGEAVGVPAARRPRWLVSVLVGRQRRGRWHLRDHLTVVAVFGVVTVDLGTAQPEARRSFITVITAFGGASIIVPQGVAIELSGFALFGGRNDKRAELPPLLDSPVICVRAFSLFGGINVEDRVPRRDLLDVIRTRPTSA
jgi:Cell wall-active antibiotics response 4TMS YvqF